MPPRYDTIGRKYAKYRRPDPQLEAQIHAALGDARTVLNVGAGTGSYVDAGLRELQRVARRQVVLTWDPVAMQAEAFWLTRDSVPEANGADWGFAALPEILTGLGDARVESVPIPHDCRDGFFRAYWRRPEAYLDPDVRASISALALVDDAMLAPGLERLRLDLESGEWHARNADVLHEDALDLGYRLVIAGP